MLVELKPHAPYLRPKSFSQNARPYKSSTYELDAQMDNQGFLVLTTSDAT